MADLVSWTFSPETSDWDRDEPLLIDPCETSRSLSFNQLRTYVRQLVSGLTAAGVQPGDCVCVDSFNDILYSVLYLGIMGAGARFTGVNPAYTAHELVHHLQLSKAKFMIVEPRLLDAALAAATECGLPRSRIFVFDIHDKNTHDDLPSWTTLLQNGERDWVTVDDPSTTVASYASTSGTSGLPKLALLSHSYHQTQAALRCSDLELTYKVRRLTALPPFHVFATPIVPASIHAGYPTYIMRRFDMQQFIQAIEQFGISETYMPPPVLVGIPTSPSCTKESMRSLRQIWMGGAGVTFANQLPMYNVLQPGAQINQVWGMTEAGWVTAGQWPEKLIDDSVGRPLSGFQLRVVDDDGNDLTQDGATGNLLIKSPHLMLGYLSNPKATAETIDQNGWLASGDVGYLTDGKCVIIDRKKELIKVRGWQVSPAEVEGALLQHPDVLDAAVIGVHSGEDAHEVARAYVVRKPGSLESCDKTIQTFLRQTLANYKVPEQIVFTDAIPKNSTGKTLRRVLRENVAAASAVAVASAQVEPSVSAIAKVEPVIAVTVTVEQPRRWPISLVVWASASKSWSTFLRGFFFRLRSYLTTAA